jgi:formyltetrahydrofolate deformylase
MRIEVEPGGFTLDANTFAEAWASVAGRYNMRWRIDWGTRRKRMAILVSREEHCLNDLLWRWRTNEIDVDIPIVVSNHDTFRGAAESVGIVYHHLPLSPETKSQQEQELSELIESNAVDFLVLARYMQILSPEFVARYPQRIINIHHSFLPAFAGSKPYHQAFDRGVKVIGASSHYVTDELDAGPIIAQSVTHVDHRDTIKDLIRKGRDLERMVLATAVRQHVEDRILVSKNKTVVFE